METGCSADREVTMAVQLNAKHLSNTSNVIAFGMAVTVAVGKGLGKPWFAQYYESSLLACLAAIAVAMFTDRVERGRFEERIFSIAQGRRGIKELLERFEDLELLESRIRRVRTIWVSGFVMANFLLHHDTALRNWLTSDPKRKLTVLLGPPGKNGAQQMEKYCGTPSETLEHEREAAIGRLRQLQATFGDRVDWRCNSVVPPHNLLLLDPDGPGGTVQVHLNQVGRATEDAILFRIDAAESPTHFQAFRTEFSEMWSNATSV
jgi:hypothetical protein